MPARKKTVSAPAAGAAEAVGSFTYPAKRRNIPPAGLEAQGVVRESPRVRYEYNPHLPPVLRSSDQPGEADRLPELLAIARQRPLTDEEARVLADALRRQEPWLEWAGKREKPWFEVDPVALHMHERVSTQAILRVLAREDVYRDLFADPQHEYAQAVQFYQHDMDWANRMILGDSLQVMASLARREDLAGKVQMVYFDPPYGIKFASNFQPQLGQRDVKDKEQDLTREPEMVRAYRDTWTLGIHSYLAYLRDRLTMMKELLKDSGSIFVQISEENLHRVRCVMDEVFGVGNFVSIISFQTTSGFAEAGGISRMGDYIIWYAKERSQAKIAQLYESQDSAPGLTNAAWLFSADGEYRGVKAEEQRGEAKLPVGSRLYNPDNLQSQGNASEDQPFEYETKVYRARVGSHWKPNWPKGLERLASANRLHVAEDSIRFRRYADDFPVKARGNLWTDTLTGSFTDKKMYVVQTNPKVIERCLLMTTDPGDLVLDPTCGSGTTAFVAEQWGRRWITCDTSRVALALAKHRLMTAKFDFYKLRDLSAEDVARNPQGTWIKEKAENGSAPGKKTFLCKTVPHITLKSIARNASLDPIFAKHEPILAEKLRKLNQEVAKCGKELKEQLVDKLVRKHRSEGANEVSEADIRRYLLPDTSPLLLREFKPAKPLKGITRKQVEAYRAAIPKGEWKEWQVPFDASEAWPEELQDALTAYRQAWRAKMDEVNACISANAEMEELVDKPEVIKGVVRVAGPFSVEGVIAVEESPDTPIGGAPEELESDDEFPGATDRDGEVQNAEAHLDKIIRLLKASGVDFPGNHNMKFSRLEPLGGAALIHAEGEWMNGDAKERQVAVSIGPEIGNITVMQVEDVIRDANRKGYDDVVFAGFGFDAAAQDAIEGGSHPKLRFHMALIRPDVAMGDLLKTQPGSQLFTVFSAPRVKGPDRQKDGEYRVTVEGMDVYDPVHNTLHPTDRERIAAWFLDTDYDGRTFCICQAFFPDKSKWAKLARALGDAGVVDEDAFESLSGLESLPFPRPARLKPGVAWKVAVKVIDPRGNEGLRVLTVRE